MAAEIPVQAKPNDLPKIHRYITTHNGEGQAVFASSPEAEAQYTYPVPGADFFQAYVTNTFPVQLGQDKDIDSYKSYLANPPGLSVKGGSVCRIVDFWPIVGNTRHAMHRTTSLDYGIVLEGQLELTLDSGETRIMNRGDICVQRATNHAWRNTSESEWARMLFVLIESEAAVDAKGQRLEEDVSVFEGGVAKSS